MQITVVKDVVESLKELHPLIVRYPGGKLVSNYHWLDGVGPKSERPPRMELAWGTIENNQFGPWLKANMGIGVSGPGHNSFAYSPDGTELFIIYHTHTFPDKPGGNRTMYIDRVYFEDGKLIIDGPTKSPQPYPSKNKKKVN